MSDTAEDNSDTSPVDEEKKTTTRERFREFVPTRRDRLTPVERLRRRAVPSDKPLFTADYADAESGDVIPGSGLGAFRVVCWNIEDGLDVDGAIAGLTAHPNLSNADVVCLQEMDHEGVDRIGRQLKLNYVYLESSTDERSGRGFGNAVLSPWPLVDHVAFELPHVAKAYGRPRATVGATVLWPSPDTADPDTATPDAATAVAVWSLHAEIPSLSLSRRIGQYTAAAAKATAPNPDYLVLAGDFNTSTAAALKALDELYDLFELERASAAAGPSLRRAGKLFSLDHIFTREMTTMGTGVERSVIASDHWPLWALLIPSNGDV